MIAMADYAFLKLHLSLAPRPRLNCLILLMIFLMCQSSCSLGLGVLEGSHVALDEVRALSYDDQTPRAPNSKHVNMKVAAFSFKSAPLLVRPPSRPTYMWNGGAVLSCASPA